MIDWASKLFFSDMTEDDLPHVLEIRNHPDTLKCLHTPVKFTLEQCKKWFRENRPIWFVIKEKDSQKVIGYFRTSDLDHENRSLYVGCDIHPSYRRMGIATCAYKEILRMLEEDGWECFRLKVLKTNAPALNLYLKIGFKKHGEDDMSFYMEKYSMRVRRR